MATTPAAAWLPSTASRRRVLASPLPPFAAPISIHMPRRSPPPSFIPHKPRLVVASAQFDFSRGFSPLQINGRQGSADVVRLRATGKWQARQSTPHVSKSFVAVQTAWRVGNDAMEAGSNLVPGSVPRPIARIGVAFAAVAVALFLVKSVVSTALFVLAMMGLIYLGFLAMNPKEASGSRLDEAMGGDPSEDPVEEARRIMDKYK